MAQNAKTDDIDSINRRIRKLELRAVDAHREVVELRKKRTELAKPAEPNNPRPGEPLVVRFTKRFPGAHRIYNYAAIRGALGPRPWAVTQTTASERVPSMSWDELLAFIGETHWGSIVVLQTRPVAYTLTDLAGMQRANDLQRMHMSSRGYF